MFVRKFTCLHRNAVESQKTFPYNCLLLLRVTWCVESCCVNVVSYSSLLSGGLKKICRNIFCWNILTYTSEEYRNSFVESVWVIDRMSLTVVYLYNLSASVNVHLNEIGLARSSFRFKGRTRGESFLQSSTHLFIKNI